MITERATLSRISESLPESFEFYGLGTVARTAGSPSPKLSSAISGKSAIGFKLLGETTAFLIVLFDSRLDRSMFSEIGNVIASKLCQALSEKGEGDLMITPPLEIRPEQLQRICLMNLSLVQQSYEYLEQEGSTRIDTLILPISAEGQFGHA